MPLASKRLQLLTQPSFRWYVTSCLLATFASGLSYVTLSWLILQADNSVAAISILMFCFWAPTVFLGPIFGVVADRYSRKWLLVSGNAVRGLVLILFGWYFHHHLSAHSIYFLMFLLGVGFSVYLPSAIALIREVVIPKDLLYANSTIDIAYEVGNVTGMGLAGFFIIWLSSWASVLFTGIIFILSTWAMARVKPIFQQTLKEEGSYRFIFHDFKSGLIYLRANPKLILIYSIQLLILVAFLTAPVLIAPFVKDVLHGTVTQFGRIDAALSVGVIAGGIFAPWLVVRWGFINILLLFSLLLTIFLGCFGLNRSILGAEILYLLIGVCLAMWPLIVTRAQHLTEFRFQARLQSVFNSLSGIIILVVYVFVDIGSHYIPMQWWYAFEVLLAFISLCLLWTYRSALKEEKPA